MIGAHNQANFLTPQIDYGGGMGDYWNQYRRNASAASQDQIDFDKSKSSIMNPAWQRFIQMTYLQPSKQENYKFNR